MSAKRLPPLTLLILILSLAGPVSLLHAQETITPNENKLGEVTAANLAPLYTFTAEAGESLNIEVLGLTPGFAPFFEVLDNAGAVIQRADNPTNAASVDASVVPAQSGPLSIRVRSANGTAGQFVLRVQTVGAAAAIPLFIGQPINDFVDTVATVKRYSFNTLVADSLVLTISNSLPTGGPAIALKDAASGEILGSFSLNLAGGSFFIPPGSHSLILEVTASGVGVPQFYTVELLSGATLILATATLEANLGILPTPTATIVQEIALPQTGPCVLATVRNLNVNVRNAPSTEGTQILTRLAPDTIAPVIGRLADGSWWQINVNDAVGWSAASVTRLGGDCSSVSILQPPTPTPVPTGADLVITGISTPAFIFSGDPFSVTVTISNQGGTPAGAFQVNASFGGPASPNSQSSSIGQLAPGASIPVPFSVTYTEAGTFPVNITVDDGRQVGESNEFNNQSSTSFAVRDPAISG